MKKATRITRSAACDHGPRIISSKWRPVFCRFMRPTFTWVILGAFFTRGRPRLAALHVATLVYGMIVEIFGFWCPLTALEEWLEVRGNVPAYHGPFLLHYLDAVVYPDIPPNLLIAGAVAVCIMNLWIYARRLRVRHSLG